MSAKNAATEFVPMSKRLSLDWSGHPVIDHPHNQRRDGPTARPSDHRETERPGRSAEEEKPHPHRSWAPGPRDARTTAVTLGGPETTEPPSGPGGPNGGSVSSVVLCRVQLRGADPAA